ncbi:pyrroline-5-carboxylate reductase family protein [uncultured Sphingomonas sp.]|uniref:pyrroline-5-carboxylate reductase family protein n=1 Tax=uncultured Sphingomonas sp. TaxID=158754 RepID=UPI0035CA9FCF
MLMVGCGNMGGAMLRRWLAAGLDPARITVVSPSGRAMPDGVAVVRVVPEPGFDTIILAIKPQKLGELRETSLRTHAPRLLVSILAGVDEAAIAATCRAGTVVRAMPNLPVAIGRGVTALFGSTTDGRARRVAEALCAPLGHHEWIAEERLFDAVTALAGSGPAFLFRFVDALAKAGTALGLPLDQARRLAMATVEGSAMMAAAADEGPAMLADRVASPGGSTREGLNVLDAGDALVRLLTDTLAASERRNGELAGFAR